MIRKKKMIGTLSQLHTLRERKVTDLSGQLAQQKQLVQRYHENIESLSQLTAGEAVDVRNAVHLVNRATYKAHIQRVIDWQNQAVVIAEKQQETIQGELITHACQEKTVALMRSQQQQELALAQAREQQKLTDAQAMQCWVRNRRMA